MSNITRVHLYRVDLKGGAAVCELAEPLMHQDAQADAFTVALRQGEDAADLAGAQVYGYLHLLSTGETLPLTGSVNGSAATITFTEGCYARPGRFCLSVQIALGDVRRTVLHLSGMIHRTGTDYLIPDDGGVPTVAQLMSQLTALLAEAEAARAAMGTGAPPILCEAEGIAPLLPNAAEGRAFTALRLFGQTTLADGALTHTGSQGGVRAALSGANLFDASDASGAVISSSHAVGEKLSVTASSATTLYRRAAWVAAGKPYTISYATSTPAASTGRYSVITDENDVVLCAPIRLWSVGPTAVTFTPEVSGYLNVCLDVSATNPVLTPGSAAAAYTAPLAAQTADLDIQLCGVPVDGEGTYVLDGQSWLADEVDLARGVVVRRCGVIDSYADEVIPGAYLSSTGDLSEGAQVVYALDAPEETALEVPALTTRLGDMALTTDAAFARAVCTADTKRYIDAKLA